MKNVLLFIMFSGMIGQAAAQTLSGTVTDKETREPIAFASVGVTGSGAGTLSKRDGTYSVKLGAETGPADTVKFYMIGYESLDIPVSELPASSQLNVSLAPKSYDAGKVTIKPASYKRRVLGNEIENSIVTAALDTITGSAFELGILLNFKKEALLEKFSMKVRESSFERLLLRLNVYRKTGEAQFENILSEPIYIELGKIPRPKMIEVDLTPYDIYVEGDTLVAIEHIEDTLTGQLYFQASFTGSACYSRKGLGSEWKKNPVKIPFLVTAKVAK